jgi:dTDP-4-dehydrorhamnose reductase
MKQKINILVTGAGSQLGKSLQNLPSGDFIFDFQNKDTLDIRDENQLNQIFEKKKF